jgi:hypothetical protein
MDVAVVAVVSAVAVSAVVVSLAVVLLALQAASAPTDAMPRPVRKPLLLMVMPIVSSSLVSVAVRSMTRLYGAR